MSVETLVCQCGMRLRLPGAVPGRVGKCPRCGSLIKVPEPAVEAGPGEPSKGRATFVKVRVENRKSGVAPTSGSDGFVGTPPVAETRFRDSVFYPLWNASGLSVLAFMPVGLWFATAPLFALVPVFRSNSPFSLLGMILLLPQLLLLFVVAGYTLLFLGQVLVTSSLGEVAQPRSPAWSLAEIGEGLGRWFWALLVGGVVGGLPTLVYWINCGDIDWLDWIVLVDLVIPGLAYAQMALLAALIFESPLAANPITVIRAIRRVGWTYVGPCVMTGSTFVILVGLFVAVLQIRDPLGQTVAYWGFWLMSIYATMVVLRRLGLFCYRHAVVLEWFPGRTRSRA